MRIYIAYKYRYVPDKEALRKELQTISDFFAGLGHTPFVLGRDVQKWDRHNYSKISTFMDIVKNIGKHDLLFVYINNDVHTNGIPVEFILAKLNGLKTIISRKSGINPSILEKFADKSFTFDSMEDCLSKAKQALN